MLDSTLFKGHWQPPKIARRSYKPRKWTDFETFIIVSGFTFAGGLGVATLIGTFLNLALLK